MPRRADFAGLVDAVAGPLVVYGQSGDLVAINGAAERLLQLTPEEQRLPLQERLGRLQVEDAAGRRLLGSELPVSRALRGERVEGLVFRLRRTDSAGGAWRWVSASAAPLREAGGELVGAVLSLTDVTELHETQEALARMVLASREDARLREQILAVVSHDLRNPLSAILLGARQLATGAAAGGAQKARAAGERIARAADRMRRMIGDLLDAAAIQSGRLAVHPVAADPRALAEEAREAFQHLAEERRLELEVRLDGKLPELCCDHDRVLQALSNLIGNAVALTPAGGRVTLGAAARDGGVELAVSDTGPGIPPDELPRIFEPYRRGKDAPYRGTGLGLAIVRGIAEAHGGRVRVESRVGEGTTFRLWLPALTPACGQASAPSS